MGLLDSVKKAIKGKGDTISKGIDKAADVVDDKTKGKHSSKIDGVAEKAKDVVDDLDEAPAKADAPAKDGEADPIP